MQGWVVSIGGQKGGSAKSTVAQGLAVEAERNGATAILADMDIASKRACAGRNGGKQPGSNPKSTQGC